MDTEAHTSQEVLQSLPKTVAVSELEAGTQLDKAGASFELKNLSEGQDAYITPQKTQEVYIKTGWTTWKLQDDGTLISLEGSKLKGEQMVVKLPDGWQNRTIKVGERLELEDGKYTSEIQEIVALDGQLTDPQKITELKGNGAESKLVGHFRKEIEPYESIREVRAGDGKVGLEVRKNGAGIELNELFGKQGAQDKEKKFSQILFKTRLTTWLLKSDGTLSNLAIAELNQAPHEEKIDINMWAQKKLTIGDEFQMDGVKTTTPIEEILAIYEEDKIKDRLKPLKLYVRGAISDLYNNFDKKMSQIQSISDERKVKQNISNEDIDAIESDLEPVIA